MQNLANLLFVCRDLNPRECYFAYPHKYPENEKVLFCVHLFDRIKPSYDHNDDKLC